MDNELKKLHEHILRHPNDYQAVIAEIKLHSKLIEHEKYLQGIDKMRHVAEIRRERNEKRRQRNGNGRGLTESDSSDGVSGDALPDTI